MQDDFYNAKSKKGTIFHRIKNMSAANKTKPVNIPNEQELIDFLKQCVVSKDKQKLKSKLGETVDLRRKLMSQSNNEFADFMAFYFEDPELVGFLIQFSICAKKFIFFDCRFSMTFVYSVRILIRMLCARDGRNC